MLIYGLKNEMLMQSILKKFSTVKTQNLNGDDIKKLLGRSV